MSNYHLEFTNFYRKHDNKIIAVTFTIVAFLTLVVLLLTENFVIFSPLREIFSSLRTFLGIIYAFFLPGFILVTPKDIESKSLSEILVFQVCISLCTLIILRIALPDNSIFTIYSGISLFCLLFLALRFIGLPIEKFLLIKPRLQSVVSKPQAMPQIFEEVSVKNFAANSANCQKEYTIKHYDSIKALFNDEINRFEIIIFILLVSVCLIQISISQNAYFNSHNTDQFLVITLLATSMMLFPAWHTKREITGKKGCILAIKLIFALFITSFGLIICIQFYKFHIILFILLAMIIIFYYFCFLFNQLGYYQNLRVAKYNSLKEYFTVRQHQIEYISAFSLSIPLFVLGLLNESNKMPLGVEDFIILGLSVGISLYFPLIFHSMKEIRLINGTLFSYIILLLADIIFLSFSTAIIFIVVLVFFAVKLTLLSIILMSIFIQYETSIILLYIQLK